MPPVEELNRDQYATLWPLVSTDAYNMPVVGDPVVLNVRWEEDRREVRGADGTPVSIDVTVYVDREIAIGSQMRYGPEPALTGTGTFYPDGPLYEVVHYKPVVDFKGRNTLHTVYLARFKDAH